MKTTQTIPCLTCGQISEITLEESFHEEDYFCPRCETLIYKKVSRSEYKCYFFSLTALILFIPAMIYPMLEINMSQLGYFENRSSIWESTFILFNQGYEFISVAVFFTAILLPFLFLLLININSLSRIMNKRFWGQRFTLFLLHRIESWVMIDVFLIATLVSIVKLVGMFTLSFGIGFALITSCSLLLALTERYYQDINFWDFYDDSI